MDTQRPYQPIDCEFHDLLEASATKRHRASFELRSSDGSVQVVQGRIVDLHAHAGIEYMQLDSGVQVRMDDIVSIDGVQRPAQPA